MSTARESALINDFLDAVVLALSNIGQPKSPEYISTPASKPSRIFAAGDLTGKEKPFYAVSLAPCEFKNFGAQRADLTLRFFVHCIAGAVAEEPESKVVDLMSDAVLALLKDVTLGGRAISSYPSEAEPNLDLAHLSGLAIITLTYEATIRFDASAT